MPHILLSGYDETKCIKQLNIHLEIQFSKEYHKSIKANEKLRELENKMSDLIKEYFPDYECEQYTNHEYNTRMNNH